MRTFLLRSVVFGIPYGLFMGLFFAFMFGGEKLWLGLLAGLLFGPAMACFVEFFSRRQKTKLQSQRTLPADEPVIWDGPANHFVNGEAVGGWLTLTGQRLLFQSHRSNIQNHELSIPLENIDEVGQRLTWGLIGNGLLVQTVAGDEERFVVEGNRKWVALITDTQPTAA